MRYVEPGNLLIVGNRDNVHRISLQRGAAVLITGGFDTTEEVKALADELELPVISCSYDTFTVATMINRAIYDRSDQKGDSAGGRCDRAGSQAGFSESG